MSYDDSLCELSFCEVTNGKLLRKTWIPSAFAQVGKKVMVSGLGSVEILKIIETSEPQDEIEETLTQKKFRMSDYD